MLEILHVKHAGIGHDAYLCYYVRQAEQRTRKWQRTQKSITKWYINLTTSNNCQHAAR